MRPRFWRGLAGGALMLAAALLPVAPAAYADVEFCGDEPPILVRTPEGNPVLVNNFLRVPFENRGSLRKVKVSAASERADTPDSTRIRVTVMVPGHGKNKKAEADGDFDVEVKSVVQRYEKISAQAKGRPGQPITLELVVPVP